MTKSDQRFSDQLLGWFRRYGRTDLPWQQRDDAYAIWVSEIMLQQTQVATVIPYFQRFMRSFPSVADLAAASIDEVLDHWSGLGYYARGRNLHAAAKMVVEEFGGQFPQSLEDLQQLPGVGRSTAGAILAQAFEIRAPILDGNVKRVLTRYHGIEEWPGYTAITKQLWELAEQHTPQTDLRAYTQAIMDLGATLCTRSSPDCERCPLAEACQANQLELQTEIPARKPAKVKPTRKTRFLIIENEQAELLLVKRPPTGIWGGLWSFPEQAAGELVDNGQVIEELAPRQHTFSHFHLEYQPVRVRVAKSHEAAADRVMEAEQSLWYNLNQPPAVGLPAPIKSLIEEIKGNR